METIFLTILNFIKTAFSGYFGLYVLAGITAFFITVTIIEILLVYLCKTKLNFLTITTSYLFLITLSIMVGIIELSNYSLVFVNVLDVFTFNGILILIAILNFFVLSFKTNKLHKKQAVISHENIIAQSVCDKDKTIERLSCIEEPETVFMGYLDVSYVKELLSNFKNIQISEDDLKLVEELEVYLLNFSFRQPNFSERQVLSDYLTLLIKLLSKYGVA